ncbi:hypothetical protein RDWZM_004491 [Blomia tropicalis]|uniref:Coatomer subunit epsilon n=1 Tax=Blomia tropicalis TaxID=40697 RepID=A0A9Q0RLE4_BLOTA|nr:hypothetical protein RDWZM_004491 [Blomia tropicalis]
MAGSGPDILFDIKNAFYLGNWQQCLNEVQKCKVANDEEKLESDIFMYRAYIAQKKYGLVLNEINSSKPESLQSVKLFAQYLSQSSASSRSSIVEQIDSNLDQYTNDPISSLMAATIYYYEQNFDTALKVLNNFSHIECMALKLQIFLQLDRFDLARKEYKRMAEKDEYCTLSQLAQAWINLFCAGEKLQDAFFIFQELKEKFGSTPLLLNGQACCLIAQGKYQEAEPLVQETIDKDPNYTESIINQMLLAQYNGKSLEVINRYLNQLKDDSGIPGNVFLNNYSSKEREFDSIVLQYKV